VGEPIRDWNSPVEVLRAKVASLAVYIHVTEKHAGEMSACPNGECTSAWAAIDQTEVGRELLGPHERHAIEVILDRVTADPDDDAAIVARAALRLAREAAP
jgi:diaminopimelate epimerase